MLVDRHDATRCPRSALCLGLDFVLLAAADVGAFERAAPRTCVRSACSWKIVPATRPTDRPVAYIRLMRTILLIILVLLLIGALPAWPYSSGWGFYPGGGLLLLIILILVLWRA